MLRSMSSAISGMQAFQTDLDVVGNNIANVNTVGFKSSRTDFSDVLSQTMSGGSAASSTGLGGTNPRQIGLGTRVSDIELDFSQGPDQTTSNPTDLAINGSGLFVVSPDATDNTGSINPSSDSYTQSGYTSLYSRAGNFTVDEAGDLVLPNGYTAMGYPANSNGSIKKNGTSYLTGLTKININDLAKLDGVTLASAPDTQIGADGSINVSLSNGNKQTIGYLALANFPNTAGLQKQGDNLFAVSAASGTPTYGQPGDTSQNLGVVTAGELEMSNVDLAHEFSEMIMAQNGFTANTHMIGTDNQVLQALVNMQHA